MLNKYYSWFIFFLTFEVITLNLQKMKKNITKPSVLDCFNVRLWSKKYKTISNKSVIFYTKLSGLEYTLTREIKFDTFKLYWFLNAKVSFS